MTEKEQKYIFDQWLHCHKGIIFKVVRVYASLRMDRDDLFQDIALQIWRSVPAFREDCSVTTWLYRISLNTAIKWIKKEHKHNQAEELGDRQHILGENGHRIDEMTEWLYDEIYQLDAIDRSVTLLLLDNFSYKEIAAILGITQTNVGVKINRIKKYLISKSKKYDHHGI